MYEPVGYVKFYWPKEACKKQIEYCRKNRLPDFAPSDGWCWHCGENIYDLSSWGSGYTLYDAENIHITSCPHCHYSFVD